MVAGEETFDVWMHAIDLYTTFGDSNTQIIFFSFGRMLQNLWAARNRTSITELSINLALDKASVSLQSKLLPRIAPAHPAVIFKICFSFFIFIMLLSLTIILRTPIHPIANAKKDVCMPSLVKNDESGMIEPPHNQTDTNSNAKVNHLKLLT